MSLRRQPVNRISSEASVQMSKRRTASGEYDMSEDKIGAQGKQGESQEAKHIALEQPVLMEVSSRIGEEYLRTLVLNTTG